MVELTELLDQLRSRLPDIAGLRPLTGGASSLTFAGQLNGRRVVVKVAPPGIAPTRHRDVLRQARVIKALGPTPVPVPEVLREDQGNPPEVPPLFVMSWIDGSSCEPLFDPGGTADIVVAERFQSAAVTLAQLHRIRPAEVGLDAEPIVGVEAEVGRWCRALETVDPGLAPGWRDVATALQASLPEPVSPAVVHGDFRLGNLLSAGNQIAGVIDWEIWSLGDPRVDVGWFLINSDPDTYRRDSAYLGMTPLPDELADIYQAAVGQEVPDLPWFQALACFKSVATWALIVKHNRRRFEPDAELNAMSEALPHLLSRAQALLGQHG